MLCILLDRFAPFVALVVALGYSDIAGEKKPADAGHQQVSKLVAGAGFEPTTFGL